MQILIGSDLYLMHSLQDGLHDTALCCVFPATISDVDSLTAVEAVKTNVGVDINISFFCTGVICSFKMIHIYILLYNFNLKLYLKVASSLSGKKKVVLSVPENSSVLPPPPPKF